MNVTTRNPGSVNVVFRSEKAAGWFTVKKMDEIRTDNTPFVFVPASNTLLQYSSSKKGFTSEYTIDRTIIEALFSNEMFITKYGKEKSEKNTIPITLQTRLPFDFANHSL